MTERYVMALDQGTTSSRAILFDRRGRMRGSAQHDLHQIYPQPGWVEHDPREIASSQFGVMIEAMVSGRVSPDEIDSIGITNQRETTIMWDRRTGEPICNAIVWQCRRTAGMVERLCGDPDTAALVRAKTGLVPDAYFSASKIKWMLDNVEGARAAAEEGRLAFGTVDSWLIWCLTNGTVHATDVTNASRTMLFDIHEGRWDDELLELFDIPASVLPEVRPSSANFGVTAYPGLPAGIPIRGVAGDQQAALFGQCCFSAGRAKNTYGTGCFLLMHTGERAVDSSHGLVTTIAASAPGTRGFEYALEGSVFVAGALIQWLRDELGIIESAEESEALARTVADSAGVYVVPAFTGLGAPYWDAQARGALFGLTRGTGRAHIARAAIESLAFQVADVARTMERDARMEIDRLDVDGGASANDLLMQFQADILGAAIDRPAITESTALGAAFLAGLSTGFWSGLEEVAALRSGGRRFLPAMDEAERAERMAGWHDAVGRTLSSR
ncbi:MAG: glycerol kinase GlpK [Slackia sp.]|nr:glycerol kinase GlpK [Slackia sp.]